MALLVLGGAVAGVMVGLSAGDVDDGRVEITDTPRQSETSLRGEARADQRGDTSASDARTGGGGTDSPTTSTPVTTQPDPTAAPRDGTIFGGVVKVRTGPGTGYGEVMTLRNEEGSAVRVTGPVERGWFPVSIHGEPGHIYGGFIVDAVEPGFALKAKFDPPDVFDGQGYYIDVAPGDRSGDKLYATGYKVATGRWQEHWPVTLADGRSGYVHGDHIEEAR